VTRVVRDCATGLFRETAHCRSFSKPTFNATSGTSASRRSMPAFSPQARWSSWAGRWLGLRRPPTSFHPAPLRAHADWRVDTHRRTHPVCVNPVYQQLFTSIKGVGIRRPDEAPQNVSHCPHTRAGRGAILVTRLSRPGITRRSLDILVAASGRTASTIGTDGLEPPWPLIGCPSVLRDDWSDDGLEPSKRRKIQVAVDMFYDGGADCQKSRDARLPLLDTTARGMRARASGLGAGTGMVVGTNRVRS
jgi:hypothetical protein